jgi:PKD repeat protein
MKRLILLVVLMLLIGTVSADAFSAWSAYGDAWKATNDTYTLVMWNSTGSHTWLSTGNATSINYLVVGGGAGGGGFRGGGGGAGGVRQGSSFATTGSISVAVGLNGTGGYNVGAAYSNGGNGTNSSFGTIWASGGGGGIAPNGVGYNGSSGGGAAGTGAPIGGTGNIGGYSPVEGYAGGSVPAGGSTNYVAGGGGGASAVGANGNLGAYVSPNGNGGAGRVSYITGTAITYGGGGGGGAFSGGHGVGGAGGGGDGSHTGAGVNGTNGLGAGGGGAGGESTQVAGGGGTGVVIISYSSAPISPISASFTQTPNPSSTGQAVTFTDTSAGTPVTWNWTLAGTITNTTQNAGYTYSTAGVYNIFLNVTNATGSWSNTSQTHTVVNASGLSPQDVWMQAQYLQTFHITDSSTGLPIATVTLTDTAGSTNTTIAGTGILTEPFGATSVTFVATGYSSRAISYFFDSDATWDVQLTPVAPATIKQQSIWYTPKQISIAVVSYYPSGKKIPAAHIELRAVGNSLQADSQLQTIYGINPEAANEMLNGTLIMNSTTSMDGVAVFTVLASINYIASVTDPSTGRIWNAPINPGLDPYTIWIGDKPNAINTTEIDSLNQTKLWAVKPNAGNWTMFMQYRDLTGRTTNVRFIIKSAGNLTEVYNVSLGNPGTSLVLANKTYTNNIGDAYYYYWVATRA